MGLSSVIRLTYTPLTTNRPRTARMTIIDSLVVVDRSVTILMLSLLLPVIVANSRHFFYLVLIVLVLIAAFDQFLLSLFNA